MFLFFQVNAQTSPALKSQFSVSRFPKLLYWDAGFPRGMPRPYYRSYGLKAESLMLWIRKQVRKQLML